MKNGNARWKMPTESRGGDSSGTEGIYAYRCVFEDCKTFDGTLNIIK